jgi:hypothetical protein
VNALALLLVLCLGSPVSLKSELLSARLLLGLKSVSFFLELFRAHGNATGIVKVEELGRHILVILLLFFFIVFVVVTEIESLFVCFRVSLLLELRGILFCARAWL